MVNTHMNMHCDAFQKSKAAQEQVKEQQRIQLEKNRIAKEEAEKKSKYYMAEKLKIENEKRAKQGLPPLLSPEEEKAKADALAAQMKDQDGAQVEEVTDEQADKIEKEQSDLEKKAKLNDLVSRYTTEQTPEEKKAQADQDAKDGKV